ncbi:MAG: glycosyltransferase [Clostridia bacterium]|nr:glycosyltransferase [Clostridia bacterium]
MKILVVDVAGEGGGALSVLNRYIERFKMDRENEYIVCVGNLNFEDCENVKFVKFPWVKKSYLNRFYFDYVYIKRLVKKYRPDKIFSLLNKGVNVKNITQSVCFHNALFICEKRFSLKESRLMWLYQNVISFFTKRSLKKVDEVFVQAEWVKNCLVKSWNIDPSRIFIEPPQVDEIFKRQIETSEYKDIKNLFFPAGPYPYKNHITLLTACIDLWNKGLDFTLSFTGSLDNLSEDCQNLIKGGEYPITFLGRLSPEGMRKEYERSILVFPSYIETVGLPLAEARNMGIAILAADCEYAHDVVGDYDNVTYFSPFDVAALKDAIAEFLEVK